MLEIPIQVREFLIYTVDTFFSLLSFFVIVRIFLSWINPSGYGRFSQFVFSVSEPVLAIFRRLPLRIGMLDLSALVAILAIDFLREILIQFLLRI